MIKKLLAFIPIFLLSGSLLAAGPDLYRPGDIPTGLQGYWTLTEASGTRADSSPNGNTLTDNNTVTSVSEDYWDTADNSAEFVAANSEYLSITDAAQTGLGLTGDFSVAFWCKPVTVAGIIYYVNKLTPGGWLVYVTAGTLKAGVDTNFANIGFPTTFPTGRWTHVAFTFNNTTKVGTGYVDGNQQLVSGAFTLPPSTNTTDFKLHGNPGTADYSSGLMKDAAVWNTVLTPLEIKSLAMGVDLSTEAYRPDNVSVAPTSFWKLNEISKGTATTRVDSSGSNNLTDNNTVLSGSGYLEAVGADFEASNSEYFSSADHPDFDLSGGVWSMSFWAKYETYQSAFWSIVSSGTDYTKVAISSAKVSLIVEAGGVNQVLVQTVANPVAAGTWHHFAFTEDGDTWKIYIDGVDATDSGGTSTGRAVDYTGGLEIGRNENAAGYYDGLMADVALWNGYALTATEVKNLASAFPVQQSAMVSYFKMDEVSGNELDAIGSNTLTENGTGGVASVAGQVGTARDFETTDSDYFSITDASQVGLDTDKDMTVMAWVKPESIGITNALVDKAGLSGNGYAITVATGNGLEAYYRGVGTTSTSTVSAGTFSHMTMTWDGALKKGYFDAIEEVSVASITLADNTTTDFRIGAREAGPTNFADGVIDEVLVANRYFREEEVKSIYIKGLNAEEITSDPTPTAAPTRSRVIVVT